MTHIGGVSLDTPASEGTEGDALRETLAAVSDDTDIERTISCSTVGRDPKEGEPTSIKTSNGSLVVTHRAVHVLQDGVETDADDVETIPFTTIDDAQSGGLVRRRLTITTDEETYEITAEGRPDLTDVARFLRRASWSWGRVAPRLETAREGIERLESDLQNSAVDGLERDKHRAKMALSKAQSAASRLDIAVDAIEMEIERLRERLLYQRVRWHVLQGEADAEAADEKLSVGLAHAAQPLFESAREHFEQALSIARNSETTRSKQIHIRLEEIREKLYDLEVEPVSEAYEAVEQAIAAGEPESAIELWQDAHERYEQSLESATDESAIRYQLAWIDANLVEARRAYARELAADADEHMANGHEQWARQLYMAASDQLLAAGEFANEHEHIDVAPIESQYEELALSEVDDDPAWLFGAVESD